MIVKSEIALDFGRKGSEKVYAKQGDADTRIVVVHPVFRGEALKLKSGITARVLITKPDGHTVFNDAEIEDNDIVIVLTSQCLACDGNAVAEVSLYEGERVLTSTSFEINIERLVFDENEVESSDEYGALVAIIAEAEEAIDEALLAAESANAAVERADEASQKINGMTVEAETLEPDEEATVHKRLIDGAYALEFGIPKGEKGEKGDFYFASFNVDASTGKLYINTEHDLHGIDFALVNGYLEVII